jgi:hypothetical protein
MEYEAVTDTDPRVAGWCKTCEGAVCGPVPPVCQQARDDLLVYLERVKAQAQRERELDKNRELTQWPSDISIVTPYFRPELRCLSEARQNSRAFDATLFIAVLYHVHVFGGSRGALEYLMSNKCPVNQACAQVAMLLHEHDQGVLLYSNKASI